MSRLFLLCLPLCVGGIYAAPVKANDYPTQARVEFVMGCMERHGGQNYNNMYGCICAIDKVAAQLPYAQYSHAETMSVMIRTPGERGGAFRDAPGARKEVKALKKAIEQAETSCIVKDAGKASTK